eukprot:gnl/TRDRNA2_/TRDRNA2_69546_c0_seq2.p1 gnl/TRDRNA2_/TRDRNA2_69546_c0~~gnl/TRDRNA2_/TRDRNA2_69546_c0_seq2.p1  ORF type:complete len:379 (-),score=78.97 gnl/TRDRNA2_/TRDRNA2_69546_c0_seq2:205-1278(-)
MDPAHDAGSPARDDGGPMAGLKVIEGLSGLCKDLVAEYVQASVAPMVQDLQEQVQRLSTEVARLGGSPEASRPVADAPQLQEIKLLSAALERLSSSVPSLSQVAALEAALEKKADRCEVPTPEDLGQLTDAVEQKVSTMSMIINEIPTIDKVMDIAAALEMKADRQEVDRLAAVVEGKANTSEVPTIAQVEALTAMVVQELTTQVQQTLGQAPQRRMSPMSMRLGNPPRDGSADSRGRGEGERERRAPAGRAGPGATSKGAGAMRAPATSAAAIRRLSGSPTPPMPLDRKPPMRWSSSYRDSTSPTPPAPSLLLGGERRTLPRSPRTTSLREGGGSAENSELAEHYKYRKPGVAVGG